MDAELAEILPPVDVEYGCVVPFARGSRLRFVDFDLLYLVRHVEPVGNSTAWVFRIEAGDMSEEAVLSSEFQVEARRFVLDWGSRAQVGSAILIVPA